MNCNDIALWSPEYVDGDIPDDVRAAVQAHLDTCTACRAAVKEHEAMLAAARALPRHEPAIEAVLRITDAIHAATPPRRRTEFGPVLDAEELADYLHVDALTVRQYLAEIPCFELGGKLLFRRSSVDAWLARRESEFGIGAAAGAVQVTYVSQPQETGGVSWRN